MQTTDLQNGLYVKRKQGTEAILDKLSDPDVSDSLVRILDKLDSVETMVSAMDELMRKAPEVMADTLRLQQEANRRLAGSLELLDRLTDPDVSRTLVRLIDKLDTVETLVSATDELMKKMPQLADSVFHESKMGETIACYLKLAEKLAEPKVIANFNHLLDKIDNLDAVLNILDELIRSNPELKDPDSATIRNIHELNQLLIGSLDEKKTLLRTVQGGMTVLNEVNEILLSKKMHVVIEGIATALEHKKDQVPRLGMFGILKMLGNADVQRTMGLLQVLLRSIGQRLDVLDCATLPENQNGHQ